MLDGEELALLALGYHKCYFVSLYCPQCGSVRLMAALPPDGKYVACPACTREHCHSGLIGTGFTRRQMPQFDVWMKPIDVTRLCGLDEVRPRPKRRQVLTRNQRVSAARL